jgi:OHCU decarboxylase
MTALAELNAADGEEAIARFLDLCGSRRWAAAMAAARPFAGRAALTAAAETAFDELSSDDWLEAFGAHPRIGAAAASGHQSCRGERWSEGEQASAADASDHDRRALAAGNSAYADRFGYTYIVCATGRSAAELRANLEARLENEPATELSTAASEQRKITRLRLDKMLDQGANS